MRYDYESEIFILSMRQSFIESLAQSVLLLAAGILVVNAVVLTV